MEAVTLELTAEEQQVVNQLLNDMRSQASRRTWSADDSRWYLEVRLLHKVEAEGFMKRKCFVPAPTIPWVTTK